MFWGWSRTPLHVIAASLSVTVLCRNKSDSSWLRALHRQQRLPSTTELLNSPQHSSTVVGVTQLPKWGNKSLREEWHVKDILHSAKLGLSSKPRSSKAHPLLAVSGILSLSNLLEGAGLPRWLTVLEPSHKEPYEPCVLFPNLIKHLTRNFKCLHCCWHTEVLRIQFGVFQK